MMKKMYETPAMEYDDLDDDVITVSGEGLINGGEGSIGGDGEWEEDF